MIHRFHVARLAPGLVPLALPEARHARNVLRLTEGATVEVFDEEGAIADGALVFLAGDEVAVRVEESSFQSAASRPRFRWSVASAVPKGERADWMVEKLSELGCSAFTPLSTRRSVVHPEGKGKLQRWERLAVESAKQSRRVGVMRIESLTPLEQAMTAVTVGGRSAGWYFSTGPEAVPAHEVVQTYGAGHGPPHLTLFVGPEGGWAPEEVERFGAAGLTAVGLTPTILRVETAAVAAAAVVAAVLAPRVIRSA